MVRPTTPDNITRWENSDPASLVIESEQQANSFQAALSKRGFYTYRWANAAARTAQAGMRNGDMGYQIDTGVWYMRVAAAWQVLRIAEDDTGWITVSSFSNSWSAAPSVAYRRINGIVYLRGRLTGGTTATAFTLPVGFRPSSGTNYFPAIQAPATTLNMVSISTGGAVGATSGQVPSLDNISYPAA